MFNLRWKTVGSCVILFLLLTGACSDIDVPADQPISTVTQGSLRVTPESTETLKPRESDSGDVISPNDITYLGAFRLPKDGQTEETMFSWGGEALAFNPQNQSLFIVGHDWYINVAEISVPELILSRTVAELNQAEIIQPFKDIQGNLFNSWTMEMPRVGLEVLDNKLFFCVGEHMEEDTIKGTHGYTSLDLAPAASVCVVSDALYATNDYLFKIPAAWRVAFGGDDLLTGRFRDGGWSGMGPSLFAISSAAVVSAKQDAHIAASPVLRYDSSYDMDGGDTGSHVMDDYSHADSWTGGVFVDTGTANAVLLVGTHGWGETWYGFSNGVEYPTDGSVDSVYPEVPPYPHDARGWWNDDFRATLVLFDPAQLAMVYAGELAAHKIQPYAFVDMSDYMLVERDETVMQYLGGAAYDEEHQVLYVLELFADEDKPVLHAFKFKGDIQ